MKLADIKNNMLATQDVYGPPTEPLRIVETDSVENKNGSNTNNANNSFALTISNILISVALLVLGVVAILNKKLSKTAKIVLLLCIIAVGAVILYFVNNIPNN